MNVRFKYADNKLFFFVAYCLFLFNGYIFLISYGKSAGFLALNGYHTPFWDAFFIAFTNVGDGMFNLLLIAIFYFVVKKRKIAVNLLLSFLLAGLIAQIIKHVINDPRPASYFKPIKLPFFIENIIHAGNTSFPSGHTATVFAIVMVLASFTNNKVLQLLYLFIAILVAYSRIYLSQHFIADVLVGSLIGVVSGWVCVYFTSGIQENQLLFKRKKL